MGPHYIDVLGDIITLTFSSPVMSDSILGLWDISFWVLALQATSKVGTPSWHRSEAGPIIGRPLPQSLHHLYPAHSTGRTDFRSKVMWLGWGPNTSTGSFAWSQEMASSGYVSAIIRNVSWGHPVNFWKFPLHWVSISPQNVPLSTHLFQYSPPPSLPYLIPLHPQYLY